MSVFAHAAPPRAHFRTRGSDSDAEVSDFAIRAAHPCALFQTERQPTRLELAVASGLASPHPPAQGLGLANAGAEAVDGEIEPTASMALGPKNVDSLPMMVMLGNSGLRAELPGRVA